jgi:predicted metal-dependent hydrolase
MARLDLATHDLRRMALGAETVDYVLVRRHGRRGVAFKVDAHGLTVSAPLGTPVSKIEGLARQSARWILRKLEEWRTRRVQPMEWRDGAALPYLGRALVLRVAGGARNHVELADGELHAQVREPLPSSIERAVVAWYKRAALAHLAGRAFTLARIAGLTPPRVLLSSALSRWGSCNARREVRLAWRLVKARPELIDYVVCLELAHLRHMNHSSAFWEEVARQCPDYARLRGELFATDHLYRSF